MQDHQEITKSSNNILNIQRGSALIATPGQPFEYIWVIDNWYNQSVDPISQNFVINDLTFHMQACRPKNPSQFLSVKVILVEKPPGPKAFCFTVQVLNYTTPEKSIVKRASKAFSKINAYESFTLLSSQKITENDGFLLNGSLTIVFKYSPNSSKSRRTDNISSTNPNIQNLPKGQAEIPQTIKETSLINEPQLPPKSNSMVFTPPQSIIPVISKFSGLKNQGATCYMNSILQVLYHIPSFRRIVYSMPTTGNEDIKTSIPLNLQSLFCRMQFTKSSCSTTDLTRSFGWSSSYTSRQHDVVEFARELIQNLETKLKDTELAGHISSLITGKMRTYIKGKNVDFVHSIDEDFDSLSLVVRGCSNIEQSLQRELELQELTGQDQYKSEEYGLQDAIMGTEFTSFPPILLIQLQRFEHDVTNNRNIKINDRFEYPNEIDLSPYLASSSNQLKRNNTYLLFAVIVHSGSTVSGHYYAYIKPSFDEDQWFKFDDANVTMADEYDVLNDNFGGPISANNLAQAKSYSAYLLIYVRKEDLHSIFEPVTDESVPHHIRESTAAIDMKNKSEVPPDYIDIRLDSETSIRINSMRWLTGFHNNTAALVVRIDSDENVKTLYEKVAELLKRPVDQMRLWKCSSYSIPEEPINIEENEGKKLSEILGKSANIFIQKIFPELGEKVSVEMDHRVIFLKFFFLPKKCQDQTPSSSNSSPQPINVTTKNPISDNLALNKAGSLLSQSFDISNEAAVRYIGAITVKSDSHVSDLFPVVNGIVRIQQDTPLTVFEETVQHSAQLITEPSKTCLRTVGRMLIFQVSPGIEIADCPDPARFECLTDSSIPLGSFSSSGFFDPQWSNLPIVSYYHLHPNLAPTTIGQYMNHKLRTLEAVMFDYEDQSRTGIAIVRFPANLSWPALKRLISTAVSREYEPENDSMRIYKRDNIKGGPTKYPISMKFSQSIASSLVGSTPKRGDRLHLFFSIIHGIPESMLVNMANYNVQYSEDGFTVSLSARLLILKNSTLRKVAFEMQNRGILPQSDSIRVLQVVDNRIVQVFPRLDDSVVNKYDSILRFENVPIEHRMFDDRVDVYAPVSQGFIDAYDVPHFVADPFLFVCNSGDTMGDIREPLLKWAEVPQSECDATVIMRLHCKDNPNYSSGGFSVEPIKSDTVVSKIINDGDQIFIWRPELEKVKDEVHHVTFVDHPPPRKSDKDDSKKREIEQPVKIFN